MKTRFFRDSCVESVTGCRPLEPSCIRIYTSVLRADSSERRIACYREKIAIF